jgi:hypothetical protein
MQPFKISDEILKQTTNCPRNFQCLTNENWETCIIESYVQRNMLLIKEKAHEDCPYIRSFGYSYIINICSCPTRYEIYRRYNI